jgi:hypothetical protein
MSVLYDPLFYVCIATCMTVIYLSTLTGLSGDTDIYESF